MARAKQKPQIMQMSIAQWERAFPTEDACAAYLVSHRWPDGVRCPRCDSRNIYKLTTMDWKWECPDCRIGGAYRFSHIAGTIFENTNKPLRDWFRVIHLMMTSKKGISARQLHRYMGFGSLKTAWYMAHRVRAGLMDEEFQRLMGIVEVDETYIGGRMGNMHKDRRDKIEKRGRGGRQKTMVAGAVERNGALVARVVANARMETLREFIAEAISDKVSLICTDSLPSYNSLSPRRHRVVDHARGQYVVGAVHTQTIEGFWSLVKRGMVGTFHKVSAKYLPLYVAEFQFRYNNRLNDDIFGAAISAC